MTHDELLAKIDYYLVPTNKLSGNEAVKNSAIGFMQALRAVVKLHKPLYYRKGAIETKGAHCSHCWDSENDVEYPCATIQAIEKELL